MNPRLFIRDPEQSDLGRNIIKHSIYIIHAIGFENFTFKKLAQSIGTTEAGIYRYFENKHRLLTYITTWFWTWMEYQLIFHTHNLHDTAMKIETVIMLLTFNVDDQYILEHIDKQKLYDIIISEGNKAYLTKHVGEDNKARLFKPYKDLCGRIADIFAEHSPSYAYPHSLASTAIETAHHQIYFKDYLPSLTDFGEAKGNNEVANFLRDFVFRILDMK